MWILLEQIVVEGMLSMSQAPTKDFNRAFSSTSHPWNEQEGLHHPHYIALVSCSHRTARSPRDSPESPFVCRYPACCFHSGKGGVKPKARDGLMLARIGTRWIRSVTHHPPLEISYMPSIYISPSSNLSNTPLPAWNSGTTARYIHLLLPIAEGRDYWKLLPPKVK